MTTTTTIKHIQEHMIATTILPADRVGCVVWWSATEVKIDPTEFASALRDCCPEHKDLVRDPKPQEPRGAMRRAMRRRQGAAMEVGWRWEEITDDANGLLVALAESKRDAAAKEYRAGTRFTLLVDDTGRITRSRDPQNAAEREALVKLEERYGVERGYLTVSDVRAVMVEVLLRRGRGVRLKEGGAVYFIPVGSDEVIDRLAEAVALAGVSLLRFPVSIADGYSVGQLTGAATAGLREEAAALREEAQEKLREVVEGGKKARYESLARKLEDAEALRAKARLYKSLLSITTDEVEAALREAEAAVRETMKALAANGGAA